MLQHVLYEVAGAAMLVIGLGMLWIARPVDGQKASFLGRAERYEVGYSLIVLFMLTGGFGSMLLGFTT
jgi:hypothetical protein